MQGVRSAEPAMVVLYMRISSMIQQIDYNAADALLKWILEEEASLAPGTCAIVVAACFRI